MANNIAELLVQWKHFKENVADGAKTFVQLSKAVKAEVSFAPIKQYVKDVREQNAILKGSYASLGPRIAAYRKMIEESTNSKKIEVYAKNLAILNNIAAKHPGNPANYAKAKGGDGGGGGGGGSKGGKSLTSIVEGVTGLLGKKMSPLDLFKKSLELGAKKQQALEDQKRLAAPVTGVGVLMSKMPQNGIAKAGSSMDQGNLGQAGLENNSALQVETVSEKWKKFQGGIKDGLGELGFAFMPIMSRLLDFGMKLSDTVLPMIIQAIQPIMDIINSMPIEQILNSVLTVVTAIITAIGPILEQLTPLFDSIFEMLVPLINDVSSFIVVLVEGLAPILGLVAHIISAVLGPALVLVGKILGVVIDIVKWVAKIALAILKPIIEFIALLIDGIMWLFGQSNEFSGKGVDGKPKTLTPPDPEKDSKVSALDAGAQLDKGLAGTATTATPVAINTGKNKPEKSANKTAGEIASGGPRVININGVKFAEKIELSVISAKEGINHLEAQLQEMFLRILNSGAAVQ